jgi:protein-S-isoprenylcysteine O-methyltransferase Ste14
METMITFRIIFFILLFFMLFVRIFFNLKVSRSGERIMPDKQAIRREGTGMFVLRAVMLFILVAVLVLFAINHPLMRALDFNLPGWLHWVGAGIGILSIALTIWVEIELGRQFSPQVQLRREHQLITHGPYARIRHPLYTALEGFGLSLALVSANWFFVIFFVLTLVTLSHRVSREEKMMLDEFGEEYHTYMKRTGSFFPKV